MLFYAWQFTLLFLFRDNILQIFHSGALSYKADWARKESMYGTGMRNASSPLEIYSPCDSLYTLRHRVFEEVKTSRCDIFARFGVALPRIAGYGEIKGYIGWTQSCHALN